MEKPKFIVFEGIEGSGKSTQISTFYESLLRMGKRAILTQQQWEEDQIGKLIKRELVEKTDGISVTTLQLLFIANRSNHVDKIINPNLESGNTVVCDRYWMTTAAYGAAFSKIPEVNMGYYIAANSIFPRPDVVFFIDTDPDVAHERLKSNSRVKNGKKVNEERFDKLDTLKLLRSMYIELSRVYGGTWVTIDGNKDKDEVAKEIMRQYELLFKE
jgi:dTMP kinase